MIAPRSRILDVAVRFTFHTMLLFSLFLLFRGHNQPGGGFAGGLVAGSAFVLAWVSRGPNALGLLRVDPEMILGFGLVAAVATALAPLFGGGAFLESGAAELDPAALGHVKVVSVLAFDIGVYLVVLGFTTVVLQQLGSDDSEQETA